MSAPRKQTQLTPPAPAAHDSRWLWLIADSLAAAFILSFTVPWAARFDAPTGAFDYSWMLLLHDAVATGRQFGKQIILPQGPLGFIGTDVFDPRTYWILIAARSVIALLAFWSIREAARKLIGHAIYALPWMLAVILFIGGSPDHFFPGCALLLLMNYFVVHQRNLRPSAIGLIVVLAASSLIKVNQPFYAIAVVGVITMDQLIRRNRFFFVAAVTYLSSFAILYLAARQNPSSFGTFIWGWSQVALGHADAVGLPGSVVDPLAYLFVVVILLMLIGRTEWKRLRWAGILPLAGIAAVLLLLYKHSFMRHDIAHAPMGPMVAMAGAILYLPMIWVAGGYALRASCIAMILAATLVLSLILARNTPGSLLQYTLGAPIRCVDNLGTALSHLSDPRRLNRQWESSRSQLREKFPLPLDKIQGTVDVYPHRQDVVFAYGLGSRYAPRPVVSSLVASWPTLNDLNARSLREAGAPETILFDVELVDNDFPTILDSQTLPELLARYDVVDRTGALLILHRTKKPRSYQFTPLLSQTARFEEEIAIPPPLGGPIWARLQFKKRLAGRILAALYKPASVIIALRTCDGVVHPYRLLPTLAEQGFLLSPLINDRMAYASLAANTSAANAKAQQVEAIVIVVEDGSRETSFDSDFELQLSRLEFHAPN